MTLLKREEFLYAFIPGVVVHQIMWWTRVSILHWRCINDCGSLSWFDFPLGIFYLAMSDGFVMVISFFLGAFLWGVYSVLCIRFLKYAYYTYMTGTDGR